MSSSYPLSAQKHQSELELLSLQHEIRDKNQQIRKISLRYAQLEKQFKSILQNHRTMLNHLQDLKSQIENERERNRNLSKENQKVQLEMLAIQATNAKIEEYKEEIAALKKMNSKLELAIMDQKDMEESKQIQSFKNKIKVLKEEYTKFETTSRKQFQKYEEAEKTIQSQKDQIKKFKQRISDLTIELKTLTSENESLRDRLHSRKDDEHSVKHKLNQQQQILAQRDEKIRNLNETIRTLQEQQSRLKSKYSEMEMLYQEEKSKKAEMEQQNSAMQQQVNNMKALAARRQEEEARRARMPPTPKHTPAPIEPLLSEPSESPSPSPQHSAPSEESEEPYNFTVSHNTCHILIKQVTFDLEKYPFETFLPTFLSVDFFEFNPELTDILRPNEHGTVPFDTRIVCRDVVMSKQLVYFLSCESLIVDVHVEADGDGARLGTCLVPLAPLLEGKNRLEGIIPIKGVFSGASSGGLAESMTSVQSSVEGLAIGSLEYEIHFDTPLREAISEDIDVASIQAMRNTRQPAVNFSNFEEYHIEIVSCKNLRGATQESPPDTYVNYQFYTFESHSTRIVPSSQNPEYSDEQLFPIEKTDEFTEYLRENEMDLAVYESKKKSPIGVCSLPLYKLLVRDTLEETLPLKDSSKSSAANVGSIVVRIQKKTIRRRGGNRAGSSR